MPLVTAEYESRIPPEGHGIFLLEYVCNRFPYKEKKDWIALLHNGFLVLDGVTLQKDVVLRSGQKLKYIVENYEEPLVPTDWSVLWEGEELFAVHKPADLPVSRTGRIVYNTLNQLIQRESLWPEAHMLHRLDRETSGIVLFSKNKAGAQEWQKKLPELMQRKVYHAVVYGVPSWDSRVLECHLAERQGSPIRAQMYVQAKGKWSKTKFRVLQKGAGFSLIECELFTGRKHQIRAHLAYLGYPIVGDKIYAHNGLFYLKRCEDDLQKEDLQSLLFPTHMLHAYEVYIKEKNRYQIKDSFYPQGWLEFCEQRKIKV